MSLQIWLPLTKDLRQQGVSNVIVTNNGATFNSAGKLGGCYSFGTGDSYITVDSTPLKTFTEFSFACWVKIISWNTSYSTVFAAKNSTNASWNNLIFSLLRNSSNSTLCFNISNGSSSTTTNCQTGALSLNTWYHITCTYKSGEIKLYQDGNVVSTYNTSIVPNFNSIVNLWIGKSNANSYQSNNLMNDVRIYDHCLSPMEVKQLSKGLVLHYPLNRQGWGQENLAHNTYNLAPFSTSQVEFKAYDVGLLDVSDGETVTISFDLDMTVATGGSGYLLVYNTNYPGPHQITTGNALSGRTLVAGQDIHERISYTTTMTTRSSSSYSTDRIEFYSNYSTENEIQISNIKIERGNTATPWCPNSSDTLATTMGLNGTTEYDCSGYCNNGTKTGTFTYLSDTPKYNVSTQFGSTSTKIQLPVMDFSGMANSYTFAWWQYNVSTGNMPWGFSNGNRLNCYHCSPLCWNTGDGSSNQFKDGNATVAPTTVQNSWHHMVVTGDGTATKLYIDGVYKGTATTYKPLTGTQIWISGWDSGTSYTFNGSKESDFRIYATALSAEDVKQLYNSNRL